MGSPWPRKGKCEKTSQLKKMFYKFNSWEVCKTIRQIESKL